MKTHVARITITLAATLGVSFGPASALAQNPSYKERGYGGPLYVGPNFEQGGQHTPPNYGNNPAKKRVIKETPPAPQKKKPRDVAKAPKPQPPAKQETEKEQATTTRTVPPSADDATPNTATEDSASTATTTAATCKKFDSTAGQTITVPCN